MSGPPPGDLEFQAPYTEIAVSPPDRQFAMLIHLSGFLSYLLGPLAIVVTLALWLARRDESPFINDHGREAMNYSISIWLYAAIATMLTVVLVGCFILPAIVLFDIIVVIMAAVAASGGRYFRYPITIRFIPG